MRVAVLVSGGGTNLQALIDASNEGRMPHVELALVVASRDGIQAIERAERARIAHIVLSPKNFESKQDFDEVLAQKLKQSGIDVVVLAGYLTILGDAVLQAFPDRILNVHPSLIPSFCGSGWYGLRPHIAAIERGVKITGATVHIVNQITDGGKILAQKAIDVLESDTPETLQKRVMEQCERVLLPHTLGEYCARMEKERGENQ